MMRNYLILLFSLLTIGANAQSKKQVREYNIRAAIETKISFTNGVESGRYVREKLAWDKKSKLVSEERYQANGELVYRETLLYKGDFAIEETQEYPKQKRVIDKSEFLKTVNTYSGADKIKEEDFDRNNKLIVKRISTFNRFGDKIEEIEKEKIHLPVDTFDLLNHYSFPDKESFDKFFFDNAFEIFGSSSQYPRSFDVINRLQGFGEMSGLFDVVLLSKEKEMQISSTYHFLSKSGCKIKNIKFINEYQEKWNHCDVIIDDCPTVFENKPEGKISIKINQEYNVYSEVDYSFNSVNEINEKFLLKILDGEKYEQLIKNEKEREEKKKIHDQKEIELKKIQDKKDE